MVNRSFRSIPHNTPLNLLEIGVDIIRRRMAGSADDGAVMVCDWNLNLHSPDQEDKHDEEKNPEDDAEDEQIKPGICAAASRFAIHMALHIAQLKLD